MATEEKTVPGAVLMVQFVSPANDKFSRYIDYIDRDEAVRTENSMKYDVYAGWYMDNPEKTHMQSSEADAEAVRQHLAFGSRIRESALFTEDKDQLSYQDKKELKAAYAMAQLNQSPMWQPIISFDNQYLKECGVLSEDGKHLDESAIREATRRAMNEWKRSEHMPAPVWSASIHYNTDNIHVHVALAEPIPTRELIVRYGREQYTGRVKPKTLRLAKSRVVSTIANEHTQLKELNTVMRDRMVQGIRSKDLSKDKSLSDEYAEIFSQLPRDRRCWSYYHHGLAYLRPQIDSFVNRYLSLYCAEDVQNFREVLTTQQEQFKRAYGNSSRYREYAENKINDLRGRLGNAVLKQMREDARKMDEAEREAKKRARQRRAEEYAATQRKILMFQEKRKTRKLLDDGFWSLQQAFHEDFESIRNQQIYDAMMDEIENSR